MKRRLRSIALTVFLVAGSSAALAQSSSYCDQFPAGLQRSRCQATAQNKVAPEDRARAEQGKTHVDWVYGAAISPDGKLVASAGRDQTVKLWDLETGTFIRNLGRHEGWVRKVAFSGDGKSVYSLGDNQGFSILTVATGALSRTIAGPTEPGKKWHEIAVSPDGRFVATASGTAALVWREGQWEAPTRIDVGPREVTSLAFSPDGKSLLVVTSSGFSLHDPASGQRLGGMTNKLDASAVAFSPDGRFIVVAGYGKAGLVNVAETRVERSIAAEAKIVAFDAAFSPDGRSIYLAGTYARRNDAADGSLRQTFGADDNGDLCHAVVPTKDGRFLLTTHMSPDLRLWDVATGALVRRFGAAAAPR